MKTAVSTENQFASPRAPITFQYPVHFLWFGCLQQRGCTRASAQTARPKLLLTSKPSTPTVPKAPEPSLVLPVAPPGSALYVAKRGDSIPLVARHYLSQTSYLTSSELSEAIRSANPDFHSTFLKAGQPLIVPGLLPAPIVEKSIPVDRDFEVRAVYLTGLMAASDHGIRIIRHWREVGGNAVVFDIKDSDGSVTIPFDHPLLGSHHRISMTCPSSSASCIRRTCTPSPGLPSSAISDWSRPIPSWR